MSGSGGGSAQEFTPVYKQKSQDVANRAQAQSLQPYTPYTGERIAGFTPYQQQAFTGIADRATAGSPVLNAGNDMLQKTLSGGFLQGNPYLDQMIKSAQGGIVDQYRYATGPTNQAMASASGSLDNTGIAGKDMMDRFSMTRALGDVESQMRGQNYATERANQFGALDPAMQYANQGYSDMAQLGQVGAQQQAMEQAKLQIPYEQFQQQQQYPYQQIDFLTGILNNLSGGGRYGAQNVQNQMSPLAFPMMLTGSLASNPGIAQGVFGGYQ